MPKCGCSGESCSCLIVAGNGVVVGGTGNASSPYVISFTPQEVSVNTAAAGPLDLSQLSGYVVSEVTLSHSATDVFLPLSPSRLDLVFVQAESGFNTITWPASVRWPGGTAPTLSTTVGSRDWVTLVRVGGLWYGTLVGLNFS